jgi:hypothetical protein
MNRARPDGTASSRRLPHAHGHHPVVDVEPLAAWAYKGTGGVPGPRLHEPHQEVPQQIPQWIRPFSTAANAANPISAGRSTFLGTYRLRQTRQTPRTSDFKSAASANWAMGASQLRATLGRFRLVRRSPSPAVIHTAVLSMASPSASATSLKSSLSKVAVPVKGHRCCRMA